MKILPAITNYFNGFEDSLRSRLLRNSFVVGLGITVARLLAALLQILVASHFGTSKPMDSYILAYAFAIFLQSILAGSLRTAVIPIYIHTRQNKGPEAGQLISDGLLGITLIGGLFLAVITVLMAPLVLNLIPGLDIESRTFTYQFIICLSPLLVLQALSGIGGGLLQAENYFKAPSVAIAFGAFITLSVFLLFANTLKIYALIFGVLSGAAAEVAITGYAMHMRGYKFQLRIRGNPELIKKIFDAYWPVALGAFVISFSPLIGQIMSAGLGSGNVASLGYSQRIPQFFLGIIVIILGQTVMPEFSKITASGDFEALKSILTKLNKLLMKITIPTVAVLMIFSQYLTRIIFEHGRFTHEDTSTVSYVQIFYFLQIPAYIMGIVYTQALTALRAKSFFFWSSFYNIMVTVAGNILLMRYLGLAGISLNAALLSWSIVVISYFYILMILRSNKYKSALMS